MSQKIVNVKPESREGDNIFDTYLTTIEKLQIGQTNKDDKKVYENLVQSVLIIERNLMDIANDKKYNAVLVKSRNDSLNIILKEWLPILNIMGFEEEFLYTLMYNFLGASLFIRDNTLSHEEIAYLTSYFSPPFNVADIKNELRPNHSDIEELFFELRSKQHLTTEFRYKLLSILRNMNGGLDIDKLSIQNAFFKFYNQYLNNLFKIDLNLLIGDADIESFREKTASVNVLELINSYLINHSDELQFEWILSFHTDENEPDANIFISSIHSFISAIKLIEDDIEIDLINWGNGSKWAHFRLRFKSFLSKDETKQLLEKVNTALQAEYLDKKIGEAAKIQADADKTNREIENLMSKDNASQINDLEVQLKKLSVLEKELDIHQKVEDLRAKRIENVNKLSELIRDGIVHNDSGIKIQINDILFVDNTTSDTKFGNDMNSIDGRTLISPKNIEDPGQAS